VRQADGCSFKGRQGGLYVGGQENSRFAGKATSVQATSEVFWAVGANRGSRESFS